MELSATENMRERHRIELRASRSVDAAKKAISDQIALINEAISSLEELGYSTRQARQMLALNGAWARALHLAAPSGDEVEASPTHAPIPESDSAPETQEYVG